MFCGIAEVVYIALGSFLVAVVVYVIKQLFFSLSSYMSDSTHLVGYQLIYDSSS